MFTESGNVYYKGNSKQQMCLLMRWRHPRNVNLLRHAGGSSSNHPVMLQTSQMAPAAVLLWTSRTPFRILLVCNTQLNCHLRLDKSFSSHSAETSVELPCLLYFEHQIEITCSEWVLLHPSMDLLPAQLWVMPLPQSGICYSLKPFQLLQNGEEDHLNYHRFAIQLLCITLCQTWLHCQTDKDDYFEFIIIVIQASSPLPPCPLPQSPHNPSHCWMILTDWADFKKNMRKTQTRKQKSPLKWKCKYFNWKNY